MLNLPRSTAKKPTTFRPTTENQDYLDKLAKALTIGKTTYNLDVDISQTAMINFCINECKRKGLIGSMDLMIHNIEGPTEVHAHMARQCMEQAFKEDVPENRFLGFLRIWRSKAEG